MKILKRIYKKILFIVIACYVVSIFVSQQQTLNSYASQKDYYATQIEKAEEYNETLIATKENLETAEYIEAISREKLDMYSKNERVYININK